ncbi:MAG: SgcJ/EcaC family oxidoreductase [Alphaproteobacteria bacterium]|nr:SgcJ/EcaC family oxidoreductase [Alphaproteobacteria bacterium]
MTPTEIVQAQFEAYNAQDIEAFCRWYADDCVIATYNGEAVQRGKDEIRARFSAMFAAHPQNRAWVKHRFAVGNIVIDHEQGERSPGGEGFEVAAIYTIKDGLIARLDMAR